MRWFLADAHGGADAQADEALADVLGLALDRGVELWILGDLFAVWLGLDRFLTTYQRAIIDRFRQMRRRGQQVRFVVGNRDYLVARGQLGAAFDEVIEHQVVRDVAGRRTLITHGDRTNPDDALYDRWYRLSRGRRAERILTSLPTPAAGWIAETLERRMRQTNESYKSGTLPLPALHALGRRAKAQGAEQVLLGHFHADTTIEVPDGVPVIVAPAWLDHRRILIEDGDALRSIDPFAMT